MVHDVQWFRNMDAFMAHVDFTNKKIEAAIMSFINLNEKIPFEGVVYGGWDQRVVEATKGMGAKFKFVTPMAGYIRPAPMLRHGPPTIVSSLRYVKPGKRNEILKVYQKLSDYYKAKDFGVVAFSASPDPHDPNLIHDLQVFADDQGFMSHADESKPAVKEGFADLFALYDMGRKHEPAISGLAWAHDYEPFE
jgi:quinol monooxygenase YgiN